MKSKLNPTKLEILSLGIGWQSTALYFMSALGELPLIDCAIFADPGGEKRDTYKYLEWLIKWAQDNNGPTIIVAKDKDLEKDLLNNTNSTGQRFGSIPAFTRNGDGSIGMLRRQCTGEYKIAVVDKAIRHLHGLAPRVRNIPTNIWKGITVDEFNRVDKPTDKWKTYVYPFCGFEIPAIGKPIKLSFGKATARNELPAWYRSHELPMPPKSSCKFCPYHSDFNWSEMKEKDPSDFADAVKVDYALRNSTEKGVNNPVFLHRSGKPLDKVQFDKSQKIPFGECTGNCDV